MPLSNFMILSSLRVSLKKGILFIVFLVLSIFAVSAQGQQQFIRGIVLNSADEPVAAVQVILVGTDVRTVTDGLGRFQLEARAGTYTLQLNRVGFEQVNHAVVVVAGKDLVLPDVVLKANTDLKNVNIVDKTKIQKVRDQGFNVAALDMKSLQNRSGDINQALNTLSGVRIREEGGLGSNFNFSINGFSGKQVKFFLDGIPMDNFGSSLALNNFPANMAERIEVYKGVLPVSLGTDALGGAVNVITRTNANFIDATYSLGSFNTHRASLNAAYTNVKSGFTVRANAFYNFSNNNYKVRVPIKNLQTNEIGPERVVERFHDDYESATVQFELGVAGKKYADRLLFGLIASGNEKDIQTGVTMDKVFGARTANSNSIIPTLKYAKRNLFTEGLDVSLYAVYNMSQNEFIDTTGRQFNWLGESVLNTSSSGAGIGGEVARSRNKNKDNEALSTLNATYRLDNRNTIALNYVYSHFNRKAFDPENPEAIANLFPANMNKNIVGASWNYEIPGVWTNSVFGKFYNYSANSFVQTGSFTGEERNEALSTNKSHFGAGIASAYYLTQDLMAKVSYERAYRLPESSEIFGDGLFVRYNPNLKPERSDNLNAGLRYKFPTAADHKVMMESNFIYRSTKDYIRLNQTASGANRQVINVGDVRTIGLEGDLRYEFKDLFYLGANVTWQKITDQSEFIDNTGFTGEGQTKNLLYGFRLPNIPYLYGNFDMGANFKELAKDAVLSLNYSLNYVKDYSLTYTELGEKAANVYRIPTQWGHNVTANYAMQKGKYNVSLECRNIFNNELFDSFRLQKPGRAVYVKLRYFISK